MVEPLANAHPVGMKSSFAPETELENRLLNEPRLNAGLSWHGSRSELIERDEQVVREALSAHPIFEQAHSAEARIFRLTRTG